MPLKPLTSYILFSNAHRTDSEIKKLEMTKQAGALGDLYKKADQTEKAKFEKEAADLKTKYEADLKAWKGSEDETNYNEALKELTKTNKEKAQKRIEKKKKAREN